ncbi:MAG: tripartite tricarboxylate transporter TctB family protein [Xanthobacteraceae bacterium]|nr:tripartite tricarboxylate transporter TctB family protein [Xanthobacteraceae bacterium]
MDTASERRPDTAGMLIAGVLLLIAVVIFWDTSALQLAPTYGVGPKATPYVIATGMAVLAAGNFWLSWRGDYPERESFDPKAIVLILGGLAALIAIIGLGGGFIPATAVLFAATATAFGRRAVHIDLAIGLALGFIVFLLFDKLLTLALPAGPIERLL